MAEDIISKTDQSDRIVYETVTMTVIIWKDTENLHYELITKWPVHEFSNWQEYAA